MEWVNVQLMLVIYIVRYWHMESIDSVQAFPKAPINMNIYMQPQKLPSNFKRPDFPMFTDHFLNVYKIIVNIYGLMDSVKKMV